jgi:D-galactarolactone cycloisomerase
MAERTGRACSTSSTHNVGWGTWRKGSREVRIREIRAVGLRGATPEGGWSEELRPDDVVHTLVAVHTDEGLVGFGSVFTSDELVRGALSVLEPLYEDENAL